MKNNSASGLSLEGLKGGTQPKVSHLPLISVRTYLQSLAVINPDF